MIRNRAAIVTSLIARSTSGDSSRASYCRIEIIHGHTVLHHIAQWVERFSFTQYMNQTINQLINVQKITCEQLSY
jgi:hypothetical protein